MRIWRTEIDETRAGEYERFANERSLPMFRSHDGFQGLWFGRQGGRCAVVTLWENEAAVRALETSATYLDTVAAIEAAGFIVGESDVERFDVHGDGSTEPVARPNTTGSEVTAP